MRSTSSSFNARQELGGGGLHLNVEEGRHAHQRHGSGDDGAGAGNGARQLGQRQGEVLVLRPPAPAPCGRPPSPPTPMPPLLPATVSPGLTCRASRAPRSPVDGHVLWEHMQALKRTSASPWRRGRDGFLLCESMHIRHCHLKSRCSSAAQHCRRLNAGACTWKRKIHAWKPMSHTCGASSMQRTSQETAQLSSPVVVLVHCGRLASWVPELDATCAAPRLAVVQ